MGGPSSAKPVQLCFEAAEVNFRYFQAVEGCHPVCLHPHKVLHSSVPVSLHCSLFPLQLLCLLPRLLQAVQGRIPFCLQAAHSSVLDSQLCNVFLLQRPCLLLRMLQAVEGCAPLCLQVCKLIPELLSICLRRPQVLVLSSCGTGSLQGTPLGTEVKLHGGQVAQRQYL